MKLHIKNTPLFKPHGLPSRSIETSLAINPVRFQWSLHM